MIACALGCFFLPGCGKNAGTTAPTATVAEQDDLAKVQGKWAVDQAVMLAYDPPSEKELKDAFVIITDTKAVLEIKELRLGFQIAASPGKSPKEVDLTEVDVDRENGAKPTNKAKPKFTKPLKGIYKFEGERLFVAITTDDRLPRPRKFEAAPWPKEFANPNGPGTVLLKLSKAGG